MHSEKLGPIIMQFKGSGYRFAGTELEGKLILTNPQGLYEVWCETFGAEPNFDHEVYLQIGLKYYTRLGSWDQEGMDAICRDTEDDIPIRSIRNSQFEGTIDQLTMLLQEAGINLCYSANKIQYIFDGFVLATIKVQQKSPDSFDYLGENAVRELAASLKKDGIKKKLSQQAIRLIIIHAKFCVWHTNNWLSVPEIEKENNDTKKE